MAPDLFINAPVGLLALWAIGKFLPETQKERGVRFDYSGALLLLAGLGSFIYAITEGREEGWPAWSIGLLAAGSVVTTWFYINQQKKPLPAGIR